MRRDGANVGHLFFDPEFPPTRYQELLSGEIRESLAAIAFNVEISAARQLLFADKIKNALTLGKPEELKETAALLSRGFWEVFEQIAKEWTRGESVKLPEAALAVEESGLSKSANPQSLRTVMRTFCDSAGTIGAWSGLDDGKAKGLAVIIKWKKSLGGSPDQYDAFVSTIFKAVGNGLRFQSKETDQSIIAKEWLPRLHTVGDGLDSSTKQKALTTVVATIGEQLRAGGLSPFPMGLGLEILAELMKIPEIGATVEKNLKEVSDSEKIDAALLERTDKNARSDADGLRVGPLQLAVQGNTDPQ